VSTTQIKISVPANHLMPALLGQRDEVLRTIEAAFPGGGIHVRGNEITVAGDDAARVAGLFEELVVLVESGHRLEPEGVARTIDMVIADERPSEVLTTEVLRTARGRWSGPSRQRPEALRRRHRLQRHHLRRSARPERARAGWRWPWRSRRCRPRRSAASS
jgi:phosphate starvation-inducible protein PhoH and related proteins